MEYGFTERPCRTKHRGSYEGSLRLGRQIVVAVVAHRALLLSPPAEFYAQYH